MPPFADSEVHSNHSASGEDTPQKEGPAQKEEAFPAPATLEAQNVRALEQSYFSAPRARHRLSPAHRARHIPRTLHAEYKESAARVRPDARGFRASSTRAN